MGRLWYLMEILIETAANSATKLTTGLTGGPCQLRPVVGPSRLRTVGRYEMGGVERVGGEGPIQGLRGDSLTLNTQKNKRAM